MSQELLCDKAVERTFTTMMAAGNPSGFLSHKVQRNFRLSAVCEASHVLKSHQFQLSQKPLFPVIIFLLVKRFLLAPVSFGSVLPNHRDQKEDGLKWHQVPLCLLHPQP